MDRAIKAARLGDQIRDSIALWSVQDLPGYFFTVTDVTLEPDLSRATVWVTSLNEADTSKILKKLRDFSGRYKRRLQKEMSRYSAPDISFKEDSSQKMYNHFDELLGK